MQNKFYKKLLNLVRDQPDKNKQLLWKAFLFASAAHENQKRETGDNYITHPLNVALMLARGKFDMETISAAILHDVLEDTAIKSLELRDQFGPKICQIVEGVTKISGIKSKKLTLNFKSDDDYAFMVDNYRKLLMATAKDIRVIIIKIFDRIDNMQSIEMISKDNGEFYARESIEIYAPIAERIGLYDAKINLDNLSFKYAYPKEYDNFIQIKNNLPALKDEFITKTVKEIKKILDQNKIKYYDVFGRIKHDFSLYKKLAERKSFNLDSIFDLYGFRIITRSISDCYETLGLVHSCYEPIPGKIYDFIARPKENGYQSIQTTVKDSDGQLFEIQIRTDKMDDIAKFGPAAHWHYKDLINPKNEKLIIQSNLEWQKELENLLSEKNQYKFLTNLKNEIFSEKIFVFTPKGEIIKLPRGATAVDFAFAIHTKIGLSCAGVKVNGRIMPISASLNNTDVVEIILSNRARPSIDWLNFTKTSSAKQKIRQFLRESNRENLIKEGKTSLQSSIDQSGPEELNQKTLNKRLAESRLPYNNLEDALIALAEKDLPKISLLKVLYPDFNKIQKIKLKNIQEKTLIDSLAGIKYSYAGCCQTKEKNGLIGYVTAEHIIKIHNKSCRFIKKADLKRLIDI